MVTRVRPAKSSEEGVGPKTQFKRRTLCMNHPLNEFLVPFLGFATTRNLGKALKIILKGIQKAYLSKAKGCSKAQKIIPKNKRPPLHCLPSSKSPLATAKSAQGPFRFCSNTGTSQNCLMPWVKTNPWLVP